MDCQSECGTVAGFWLGLLTLELNTFAPRQGGSHRGVVRWFENIPKLKTYGQTKNRKLTNGINFENRSIPSGGPPQVTIAIDCCRSCRRLPTITQNHKLGSFRRECMSPSPPSLKLHTILLRKDAACHATDPTFCCRKHVTRPTQPENTSAGVGIGMWRGIPLLSAI